MVGKVQVDEILVKGLRLGYGVWKYVGWAGRRAGTGRKCLEGCKGVGSIWKL